ncbi:MAG: hypothetical protein P8176_10045 [Gammaproteobacteria bacterium]
MTHPQMPDTLIESQHLYTSDEKTTVFSPGALAFSQGNIIAVGTPETVRQLGLPNKNGSVLNLWPMVHVSP